MTYNYCPTCTTKLQLNEEKYKACPKDQCNFVHYDSPNLVVVGIVRYENRGQLLSRRGINPGYGKWAYTAGFVNSREDPRAALKREFQEELGIEVKVGKIIDSINPLPGELNQILEFYEVEHVSGEPTCDAETLDVKVFYSKPDEFAFPIHEVMWDRVTRESNP